MGISKTYYKSYQRAHPQRADYHPAKSSRNVATYKVNNRTQPSEGIKKENCQQACNKTSSSSSRVALLQRRRRSPRQWTLDGRAKKEGSSSGNKKKTASEHTHSTLPPTHKDGRWPFPEVSRPNAVHGWWVPKNHSKLRIPRGNALKLNKRKDHNWTTYPRVQFSTATEG